MTRLTTHDIHDISEGLTRYNDRLTASTGRSLAGIAAHAFGADEADISRRLETLDIRVVPVTGGQGIISSFSDTVAAILNFLGCRAGVSEYTDASGLAHAYEDGTDAVMLADDHRFVGIHLHTRCVADNTELTGRVYAAVLDLLAGGISGQKALVLGCGPVGAAGARALAARDAVPVLYDTRPDAAVTLARELTGEGIDADILWAFPPAAGTFRFVLEATPSGAAVPDRMISPDLRVAAPGVPLGMSGTAAQALGHGLVHDKLELGTAAMAVRLVLDPA